MCEHTYSVNRPSTFLFIYKALSHLLTSGVSQRPHELEGQRKHTLFYKGGNRLDLPWVKAHVSCHKGGELKVAQSHLTLCGPMDCIVHVILQARILKWVAFPSSRGSSQPRDQTHKVATEHEHRLKGRERSDLLPRSPCTFF